MTHFPVRRWSALLAILALIAVLPGTGGRATAAGPAEAPRVTAEEVKRLAEKGEVVVIDTRGKDAYDLEHAEGALSMPVAELESRLAELPKDKFIAAYCTWQAEGTSAGAAQKLIEKGYKKAAAIKGGLNAWKEAGGKTVASKK